MRVDADDKDSCTSIESRKELLSVSSRPYGLYVSIRFKDTLSDLLQCFLHYEIHLRSLVLLFCSCPTKCFGRTFESQS